MAFLVSYLVELLVALTMLVGGAFVTFLCKKKNPWLKPVMRGLSFVLMIFVGYVGYRILYSLPEPPLEITNENSEKIVRELFDKNGFSVRRLDRPNTVFAIDTSKNSENIAVSQKDLDDRHITLASRIVLGTELARLYANADYQKRMDIADELTLNLGHLGIEFRILAREEDFTVHLSKVVYFGSNFEWRLPDAHLKLIRAQRFVEIVLNRELVSRS